MIRVKFCNIFMSARDAGNSICLQAFAQDAKWLRV